MECDEEEVEVGCVVEHLPAVNGVNEVEEALAGFGETLVLLLDLDPGDVSLVPETQCPVGHGSSEPLSFLVLEDHHGASMSARPVWVSWIMAAPGQARRT